MITIKRNSYIEEKQEIIRRVVAKTSNKFKIMVDLRNGEIVMLKSTKAKYYIQIGEINITLPKITKKGICNLASNLNSQIQHYNAQSIICKSRVKSEYGKSGIIDEAYVKAVDNPHYKCAGKMQLYDRNVINYYLKRD